MRHMLGQKNNPQKRISKKVLLQVIVEKHKLKTVTPETIVENGLANKKDLIKILGRGELKTKVNITAHGFSAKAKSTIEDLGGKAELIEQKKEKVE